MLGGADVGWSLEILLHPPMEPGVNNGLNTIILCLLQIESPVSSLDGLSLFTLMSGAVGGDSFTHIARLSEGGVTFLTSGPWEVTTIVGRTQDHM